MNTPDMTASAARPIDLLAHYQKMVAQAVSERPWLHPRQQQAAKRLQTLKLPDRQAEDWRYTPLPPVLQAFQPVRREDDLLTAEDVQSLRLTGDDSWRIVLLDGFFMPELSTLPIKGEHGTNDAVTVMGLQEALHSGEKAVHERLGTLAMEPQHLFGTLNTALLGEGVYVRVASGVQLKQPIELINISFSFETHFIAHSRVLLVLEEGAQATVVEQHSSLADTVCLHNQVLEIFLEPGAQLLHPRLQHESRQARHLSSLYLRQQAGSRYAGTTLALGAAWSRTEFHVDFAGEGARCDLNGFYLAGQQQSHGLHLNVVHAQPACSSRERFKGILYAQGKGVFDGNIIVKPDAQKTDARLSNDNLLLSREAEVNTKPRLEIYADDVQCSHGTTVGQLDEEMLFYLQARGIPRQQAVLMLCQGFAAEMIETCQWPALQNRALAILQQQLASVAIRLTGE